MYSKLMEAYRSSWKVLEVKVILEAYGTIWKTLEAIGNSKNIDQLILKRCGSLAAKGGGNLLH